MARRRGSSYSPNGYGSARSQPDRYANVLDLLSRLTPLTPLLDDRRSFHPEGVFRPSLRLSGLPARLKRIGQVHKKNRFGKDVLVYDFPEYVVRCAKRKIRRQVMFAMRKTGKGAKAKRRWTGESYVSCQ